MKKRIFLLVFGIIFVSCNQEKSLQEYMVKTWETSHINISMPTYQQSDSSYVYEDDFLNNPPRIAQSRYNKDGSFSAWYIDAIGEKKEETIGKWKVKEDSLYIEFKYNGRTSKISYAIQRTAEGFIGTSKNDWDQDGEFDDLLVMRTRQINLEKE